MPTVAVLGTFDTKGTEHAFLAEAIRAGGCATLLIDAGCMGAPTVKPDVPASELAAAGDANCREILARRDRGQSVALMARGAAAVVSRLAHEGKIDGIVSLGGGGGTAIATAAMRALPIGFPKLMVSTLASGQTAPYIGASDILMMPAIVDVAGINRISRLVFQNAAGAICGMVRSRSGLRPDRSEGKTELGQVGDLTDADKPIVVASMFGNTTAGVTEAKRIVEAAGYEVLVFHATGAGGRSMEQLIASGLVAGVLDITTTEWADELVGGILTAGPERLDAAGRAGVPAIVVPGCLDMVNFGEPQTVPAKFAGRRFYQHNPQVTLMRTTPAECDELGRIIAEKLNRYTGSVTVLLPRGGLSVISALGGPFHDAAADEALFDALKKNLRPSIRVVESPLNINDPGFAKLCAEALLEQLGSSPGLQPANRTP